MNRRKAARPKASSWDKISARTPGETLTNRDVYDNQQLDRSTFLTLRSTRPGIVVAVIAGGLVTIVAWVFYSLIAAAVISLGVSVGSGVSGSGSTGKPSAYYVQDTTTGAGGSVVTCYRPLAKDGTPDVKATCYPSPEAVPVPSWHTAAKDGKPSAERPAEPEKSTPAVGEHLADVSRFKLFITLGSGLMVALVIGTWFSRKVAAANLMNTTSDINQYPNDQHIALPEEIQQNYDWFPDAGAHSSVQVSSLLSHMMLRKKSLGTVEVAQRAEKDVIDEEGNPVYYAGEVMDDDEGDPLMQTLPIIDEDFGDELFEASGLPDDKTLRQKYDTTRIPYNPDGNNRDKLGFGSDTYKTVADLIKEDWTFPAYEVQRPAGAYVVDTAPVNTMVLAITRAGKGQTYIEPIIDMWSREKKPSNMVINDPKGELLVKNYVPLVTRGFEPVQFNLINSMKTDIYNPLGLAADAAREGNFTKCALYVENIAGIFFPLDGGEDPVWPNAANNAFKRAAYGLIDFYLEEERELRSAAAVLNMDPAVLEQKLDDLWGKVTLYNCYQLFVQMSAKKIKNPEAELEKRVKAGEFGNNERALAEEQEKAAAQAFMWEGKADQDMLSLYFNASEELPRNNMRTLVGNAHNALRSMAGAEKMLASVYGIAITAMSFFTDPTISTLTSGKPSQNTDLAGLSFPRRLGVRFAANYVKRDHLVGQQAVWSAYADPMFTENLGEDFEHEGIVGREGWARYNFKGTFPADEAWLKLELVNPQTKMLVRTFYFGFTKNYQVSLNGRHYVVEPVTGKKIVKNGVLRELKTVREGGTRDGEILSFQPGDTLYPDTRLDFSGGGNPEKVSYQARAITQTLSRYSESPKALFLVTPPHLMKYAKLILILVKQLFDVSADQAYMTKSNQKPLYRTRFMLDELGNLQSEGKGIDGFETMLSIGLGQEQQFTLILQTLQQLRDVYGESVDKIVQGNCLVLDAKIATPTGWTTMREVQPGDEVLTPFGTSTVVTDKYPVKVRPVYRLTLRDGSSVEACPDHLWPVARWKSSIKYLGGKDADGKRRYVGTGPDGKTTDRVEEIISTEELKARIDKGRQVDLIPIAPVAYSEADLPIDPYVLGAILGDGYINQDGGVFFFSADSEVVEEIRRRGYAIRPQKVDKGRCPKYAINGVRKRMRDLGLAGKRSWEKSIPEPYLLGSVEQRIDLLRGVMDTDGTISGDGEMEFTSASQAFAKGVQTLVRSLGGRVAINIKDKVMYTSPNQLTPKKARDAYRVQNIRMPEINPFLLSRKAERWRDRTRGFNRVISVEYVRDDEVQCIAVADERHLYLTDDFIPTHNTSNIVFLKSTDDSMIETLEKMSGTTHRSYRDSKQISQDLDKVIGGRTEGRVSYTMSTKEEPLISYNDMAFLAPRNSIVFRAGDAPIWNRNQTILPMSFRLLGNTIKHPGHTYSLQTIPTLSSAMDFDVRMNQPDFVKMLEKRMRQAVRAADAKAQYKEIYGYREVDIERLDPDVYADEVMEVVTTMTTVDEGRDPGVPVAVDPDEYGGMSMFDEDQFIENVEVGVAVAESLAVSAERQRLLYAEGTISKEMLVNPDGSAKVKSLDIEIGEAYKSAQTELEKDREHFSVGGDGELRSADGSRTYISPIRSDAYARAVRRINGLVNERDSRVFAEEDVTEEDLKSLATVKVHSAFYQYLASLPSWEVLAGGRFDRAMAIEMNAK
ncbi:type IV secretory system conjugative DNA transfer family protein [Streptomyces acidiscabies]|uniref:Type IV secretory system conjugative DNA transfer family protein n=1 Tax=Streptomyces acidiscabies TaxID=42234 RepID=A0ABU4LXI6_9ACTN|nr:type IV secretory system conjugative DNA transfer family protein [Streptomyces acidiscabies]MDX3020127.1 type IV secretory system conjugative DNA transfer family protein [Streptomyces acidiscabies]